MSVTIQWYRVNNYGVTRDYIVSPDDAELVRSLTGQKTINYSVRRALESISRGAIQWAQVLPPQHIEKPELAYGSAR